MDKLENKAGAGRAGGLDSEAHSAAACEEQQHSGSLLLGVNIAFRCFSQLKQVVGLI